MADATVEEITDIVIPGVDRSKLPEHVALRTLSGGIVVIIGTAHISEQSSNDVATVIRTVKPQQVLVELCPARVAIINPDHIKELYQNWERQKLANEIPAEEQDEHGVVQRRTAQEPVMEEKAQESAKKEQTETEKSDKEGYLKSLRSALGKQGGVMAVAISYMYSSISSQVKLNVGDDMRTAAEEAAKIGAVIVLGDRPIGITLARAWHGLSTWQRIKLGWDLLKVSFSNISAEDLEQLKNKDILTELVHELSRQYPSLCTHLLSERDLFLAHKLRSLPGPLAVGVVGMGHVEGIKKHWNDQVIDIAPIMITPPDSASISQILRRVVLSVVGGFVLLLTLIILYIFVL